MPFRLLLLAPLLTLLALPAYSANGVLEINQTCAAGPGCFSGDSAGFPVTISASGSYRLTGNLIVPDENTDAITFSDTFVSDVSIDLGGFEIRGPVFCSGSPVTCSPSGGLGNGVRRLSGTNRGISVRNGSIIGMGSYGLLLGNQARVEDMRFRWCGVGGINTTNGAHVSNSVAWQNGASGFTVTPSSVVSGNISYQNAGTGISVGQGSTVTGNASYQNGGDGIFASAGATLSGNSSYDNGGDGIQTSGGSSVTGNTIRNNDGWGLNLDSSTGYRDNSISTFGTTLGTVTSGLNVSGNVCNGSTTCP